MKIINLVNPANSEIKYEISRFPDGQQQVKITGSEFWTYYLKEYQNVCIKTRLNNFMDVELLICTVASLRELGVQNIELYAPYFLGSRSDRKFEIGGNNYLKTVICPIINAIGFSKVTVLDAHSDVLEACLNAFNGIKNYDLMGWFVKETGLTTFDTILMAPDAGALKKIYEVAKHVAHTGEIITCAKSRGVDGKITKTEVPHFDITKNVVLVDDICDGGKTFIEIAKIIKLRQEQYNREKDETEANCGKLFLVVTHGIFSKGFGELEKYFDKIYCTNSYKDVLDPTALCGFNSTRSVGDLIKQLNIF